MRKVNLIKKKDSTLKMKAKITRNRVTEQKEIKDFIG
jgi:hypothetical protein